MHKTSFKPILKDILVLIFFAATNYQITNNLVTLQVNTKVRLLNLNESTLSQLKMKRLFKSVFLKDEFRKDRLLFGFFQLIFTAPIFEYGFKIFD